MRVLAVVFVSLVAAVSGGFAAGGPPSLVVACGNADAFPAQSLWLTTSDHVRLYAIEAGTGSTTVVLALWGAKIRCPPREDAYLQPGRHFWHPKGPSPFLYLYGSGRIGVAALRAVIPARRFGRAERKRGPKAHCPLFNSRSPQLEA